jgi:hypothetical protein
MPILLVDPQTANQASVINITTDERDERTYYVVPYVDGRPDTLIVCRNGLKLPNLARHIVDAATGTDSGYVGFTKKQFIGKNRPKITIYRTLNHVHYHALLREELNRKEVMP